MSSTELKTALIVGGFVTALGLGAFFALHEAFNGPEARGAAHAADPPPDGPPVDAPRQARTAARETAGKSRPEQTASAMATPAATPPTSSEPGDFFRARFGDLHYDATRDDPDLMPPTEPRVHVASAPQKPPVSELPRHRDSRVVGPINDLEALDSVHAVLLEAHPELKPQVEQLRADIEADLQAMAAAGGR